MKYLELEIYNDFACIGSECPFTCCAGWGIIIDSASYNYYMSVKGDFGQRLKKCITAENGMARFALTEEGRCSFLNDQNLCDIYINLGEERLCYTCTTYPRYSFLAGDIVFSGVSISCPEVARFFLKHTQPLQIDFKEDNQKAQNEGLIDWAQFNNAIQAFTASVGIAQDRTISLSERLTLLTLFVSQFQSYTEEGRSPSGLIALFSDHSNFGMILPDTGIYNRDLDSKVDFISSLLGFFRRVERFEVFLPELYELVCFFDRDKNFAISIEKWILAFGALDASDVQIWLEQLLVYSIYRYFMQAFDKKDYYNKFMIGTILFYELCVSTIVLYFIRNDCLPKYDELVTIVAHTSRIIEHEVSFRDVAIEHFIKEGVTAPSFLFKLFS